MQRKTEKSGMAKKGKKGMHENIFRVNVSDVLSFCEEKHGKRRRCLTCLAAETSLINKVREDLKKFKCLSGKPFILRHQLFFSRTKKKLNTLPHHKAHKFLNTL
jgi:hypothetical protein